MPGAISQPRQSCQFLFCLMKNPLLYRSARAECSRQASERFLTETLGGTQSERRRRLALAGCFRLLRSSGMDRRDAPCARGGPQVGSNHKDGNSVTVARNRKQRTAMTMPAPYATRGVSGALFILEQRKAKAIQTIGIAKSHKAILSRVCRYLETW